MKCRIPFSEKIIPSGRILKTGLGKYVFLSFLLCLVFCLGAGLGWLSNNIPVEDRKFLEYTEEIFIEEMGSNSLNLHYTLANPADYNLADTKVSLGSIEVDPKASQKTLENYETGIRAFDYNKLSRENQITYDTLLLYFHTMKEGSQYPYMEEILSPSLGIQAQLPILLAEYSFYEEQDIQDYLTLLSQIKDYFQSILEYEQERARRGYFMNTACLDGILAQCEEFIENPEDNYLLRTFQEKTESLKKLKEKKKQEYISQNQQQVSQSVIPAYQMLIQGLEALRDSCGSEKGLCYFPQGKEYYCWLLKTQVGVYDSPDSIRQMLYNQLLSDYSRLEQLLKENPSLVNQFLNLDYSLDSPQEALITLKKACLEDFPSLKASDYEVKYVDSSLESYLSPAFYLTPPVDTLSPNVIYINQASQTSDLELFATLGHEGFPGHLYQTLTFGQTQPAPVRYLPSFGGYVEGWATYAESYAYSYANLDADISTLSWLNRSINLCLCSMVDLGVHYYGWSMENVAHYLSGFGITQYAAVSSLYETILENPSNYLRYYVGCLNFKKLKEETQAQAGEDFDLQTFHLQVLTIGPTQFPVLRKYLGLPLQSE